MNDPHNSPNPFAAPTAYDQSPVAEVPAEAYVKGRLMPPAIIMIVIAVLSAMFMIIDFGFRIINMGNPQFMPADDLQRTSAMFGNIAGAVLDILNLIAQVFVVKGSIAMIKGRGLKSARTASILSMIPCISGCCILNIPFGIWAFWLLDKPEIANYFAQREFRPQDIDDKF